MPLDGHTYLISQGWSGKGTGLRRGAISRPIAIPQKKTLAGLGKDRDEAFPFWDHLFSTAAKAIQVKIFDDDDDECDGSTSNATPTFTRTSTGILSNRRPVVGTPADASGTATPDLINVPRVSLVAIAKREAAKRGLYSRFFRGPVLGLDTLDAVKVSQNVNEGSFSTMVVADDHIDVGVLINKEKKRRRRGEDGDHHSETQERRERKRQRKELKEAAKLETKLNALKSRTEEKESPNILPTEDDRLKKGGREKRKELKAKDGTSISSLDSSAKRDKKQGLALGIEGEKREDKLQRRQKKKQKKDSRRAEKNQDIHNPNQHRSMMG